MADFGKLAAAISALTAQVAATEGTEASAVALINGFFCLTRVQLVPIFALAFFRLAMLGF